MKILVLNGSPAGKDSITLQTVEYLKLFFPEQTYETLHVARLLGKLEKDFTEAEKALKDADLLLFCYPVYTFLAPSQLHRFIELIKENGTDISGKYASQISTSLHFYDTTAERFISNISRDLGLKYVRGLCAGMEDLLSKKGRSEAKAFFRFLLWSVKNGYCEEPGAEDTEEFKPVEASDAEETKEKAAIRTALVADYDPAAPPKALMAMIGRFKKRMPGEIETINIREFPFAGGCLGCFRCASDGICFYKDGFTDYLRGHINGADAVVYAFTIKDHSMGSRFKLYDDRQFCNGHRTVTSGKPVAYIVDGKLSAEENLRTLINARSQVGGNFLAGIACDEKDPDQGIDRTARTLAYAVKHRYDPPRNFYGVGGLKIFRDLIYEMQGLMKEDHRFYKEHGFYDFPQKKKGRIAGMYLVSALMNSKTFKKKVKFTMTDGIMMPYKKVLEQAKKEANL